MDVTKVIPKSGGIQATELDLVKLISHFAYSNKAEGETPKTVAWWLQGFEQDMSARFAAGILAHLVRRR